MNQEIEIIWKRTLNKKTAVEEEEVGEAVEEVVAEVTIKAKKVREETAHHQDVGVVVKGSKILHKLMLKATEYAINS